MGCGSSSASGPSIKKPSKLKMVYFDAYGRGEPIRILLGHAKVPFEDERLTFE